MAFDTYFDILFYLLASILILDQRPLLILPLSLLAGFNRETGILIPALLLASIFEPSVKKMFKKKETFIGIASLFLFTFIFVGIRIFYGPRPFSGEYPPGLSQLKFNLTNLYSYFSIFATFTVIPLLAVLGFSR